MRQLITISSLCIGASVFGLNDAPPDSIELTGTVRDFKESGSSGGGHPDFEVYPSRGFAQYCKNIAESNSAFIF